MSTVQETTTHEKGADAPFWRRIPLAQMTPAQWESLCDGCARCCLVKLEDIDTGALAFTDISCKLLDAKTCRCTDYDNRSQRVADCIAIKPAEIGRLQWMPPTCAYRLLDEGRDLFWWHPLVSGDKQSVHRAGISVAGRHICETQVPEASLEDHIVSWPQEIPEREAP